jgi:uncharacterized protein YrrD
MDIPVNAKVECQNEDCGRTTCVIINPVSKKITHIVVQEKGMLRLERVVPVELISETSTDHITLRCSAKRFSTFEPFRTGHYVSSNERYLDYESDNYYLHPFLPPEFGENFKNEPVYEETELIQPSELGIHRGSVVHATDGKVGQVDEFLISPEDDLVSHLVLREGHLWGKKLVTIPVVEIARIDTDDIHLKLSKLDIGKLPTIPVKHHYPK